MKKSSLFQKSFWMFVAGMAAGAVLILAIQFSVALKDGNANLFRWDRGFQGHFNAHQVAPVDTPNRGAAADRHSTVGPDFNPRSVVGPSF